MNKPKKEVVMQEKCCGKLQEFSVEQDMPINYNPKFREYGIRVLDGGSSVIQINYCPWCGCKVPASKRDEWYDKLDELGLESGDPNIPLEMLSSEWWNL